MSIARACTHTHTHSLTHSLTDHHHHDLPATTTVLEMVAGTMASTHHSVVRSSQSLPRYSPVSIATAYVVVHHGPRHALTSAQLHAHGQGHVSEGEGHVLVKAVEVGNGGEAGQLGEKGSVSGSGRRCV